MTLNVSQHLASIVPQHGSRSRHTLAQQRRQRQSLARQKKKQKTTNHRNVKAAQKAPESSKQLGPIFVPQLYYQIESIFGFTMIAGALWFLITRTTSDERISWMISDKVSFEADFKNHLCTATRLCSCGLRCKMKRKKRRIPVHNNMYARRYCTSVFVDTVTHWSILDVISFYIFKWLNCKSECLTL